MHLNVDTAPRHRLPLYKTILCATCALILIVNAISLFNNPQSLKGANFLIGHTTRVADRLQYLNVVLMDAESSVRGYFISDSDVYLSPTRTAAAEADKQFDELKSLLANSPSQLKNLAQLHTLVKEKISSINESIEVYEQGGLSDIVKIARLSDERGHR